MTYTMQMTTNGDKWYTCNVTSPKQMREYADMMLPNEILAISLSKNGKTHSLWTYGLTDLANLIAITSTTTTANKRESKTMSTTTTITIPVNLAQAREMGYADSYKAYSYGYITRKPRESCDITIYTANKGKRLYYMAPAMESTRYCYRVYLVKVGQ